MLGNRLVVVWVLAVASLVLIGAIEARAQEEEYSEPVSLLTALFAEASVCQCIADINGEGARDGGDEIRGCPESR